MADATMSGLSDTLAAERTFLAWIRTGLALMGFGFVVARFGLFVQELGIIQPNLATRQTGLSVPLGTVLIALGVLVMVIATWSHVRLMQNLKRMGVTMTHRLPLAVVVTAVLAVLGLVMTIGLVSVDHHSGIHHQTSEGAIVDQADGIITVASHHSVDETAEKLQRALQAKGVKLFALIDHSGEAKAAGIAMPPTKLLIFGNPKGGTPLMLATPSIAIDLPLKLLVWQDLEARVWVSYNAPTYLQARHHLPEQFVPTLGLVAGLATAAGE
jgi:uncharacterized protein (DUF302 family)/uncharacterized membrane protein YidH (DUF202 family)